MNRISKVFLACACSVFCMNGQAQSNATWTNDFSNAGETLKVVGREHAVLPTMYSVRKALMPYSVIPNGKLLLFFQSPCP